MEGVPAFNCLSMMSLPAGVLPSTLGSSERPRGWCELRLILSRAEAGADRSGVFPCG